MITPGAAARQHLAGILAADAVGYSRLMELDEHATMAALDTARAVFRSEIEAHQGRVINTAGDSILAIFDTAAGAVTAALRAQARIDSLAGEAPQGRGLRFRVGLHLGDVMERPDGDVAGDGVNIAARLQAMAPAGGTVISEAMRGAVKSRVAVSYEDLGPQGVKNIADPVRAFAVREPGAAQPGPSARARPGAAFPHTARYAVLALLALTLAAGGLWWWRGIPSETARVESVAKSAGAPDGAQRAGKVSIAVLPFDNMSDGTDKAYFADGITEDLITDLSKVAALTVIARNSTFQYKGKARDVREIGRALDARYVLEGSVRRNGDVVRVNAQLIDATTGTHVWAERYDSDLKSIFGLQDTITRSVAKALAVEVTKDESDRLANRGTVNAQAYDVLLRGWEHYLRQTPEEFRLAIAEFTRAAELDPSYSRAWAALAAVYWEAYTRYWGPAIGAERHTQYEAEQYLAKAMRDPTPLAHEVASAMMLHNQQHADALTEAQRAVAIDPNDADGYVALAAALSFSGRPDEALDAVERAMRLNPHFPSSYAYQRGLALFCQNRLDEAAVSLERALALRRDDYWSQRLLLSAYGNLNRGDDARRIIADITTNDRRGRYASYDPLTIRAVTFWYPFAREQDARRFTTGLAKAGIAE